MLEKLIHQLSHDLAMKDWITSTEEHRYRLPFENNMEIEAVELDKSFLFKGIIGERPQQNAEAFLLKIMEANLFGMGTRGAAIGLNDDGKLLTLSLELDYNSSYKDFKEQLEDFISVLDFWRKETLNHQ